MEINCYKSISNRNIIKKIIVSLTARVVITSGLQFYNWLGLISSKVIKINTMHGSGPKLTTVKYNNIQQTLGPILSLNKFNYIELCTQYAKKCIGVDQFLLPKEKIITFGAPKNDIMTSFKNSPVYRKKRIILSNLLPNLTENTKVIYYAPTWRPYSGNLPIFDIEDFESSKLVKYLEENEVYLIVSHHLQSSYINELPSHDRIIKFTQSQYPTLDNNMLIMEVDLLISDYGTLSTDFAITGRPQLFVIPDYCEYKEQKGFTEDFISLIPGDIINDFYELKYYIDIYLKNPNEYSKKFSIKIDVLLEKYIGTVDGRSCKRHSEFIAGLIKES